MSPTAPPAYGMPGEIVDGNDVLAVWEAATRAIERARAGEGPTLIECKTFRMTGHSAHDDAGYVPPELFEFWEERDPIRRLERDLIKRGVITADAIEEMQNRINSRNRRSDPAWRNRIPIPIRKTA